MTIQEALTKAREGGYHHDAEHHEPGMRVGVVGLHAFSTIHVDDFFLDSAFWRALGRTPRVASRARLAGAVATLH